MLNCCYNVSVNLLLKFNCAKSSSGLSQDIWFQEVLLCQMFHSWFRKTRLYHLHLFLSLRFIKCAYYFSSNAVFKSLVHLHRLTAEFNSLCSVAGITNIEFDWLRVSSLKYLILDVFKSKCLR